MVNTVLFALSIIDSQVFDIFFFDINYFIVLASYTFTMQKRVSMGIGFLYGFLILKIQMCRPYLRL